ncbi:MAG: MOSC domain-containing protein [Gemmatimonadales bacterium]
MPASGVVRRVGVKPRIPGEPGLPKAPVPSLHVTAAGAEGDYNRYRAVELHGDPDQALLLVTEDLLGQLNSEGWPVRPGDLGENITLGGIAESDLGVGARLTCGEARIEITKPCDPCTELYTLPYVGPDRGPAFLKATAGRRGWYARVLTPGRIVPAATALLDP